MFLHILTDNDLDNIIASIQDYEANEGKKISRYYNYINGEQDILNKEVTEGRPNNKIIDNKCRRVLDNFLGFTNPQGIETTDEFLLNNLSEISDSVKDALATGVGYCWVYYDEDLKAKRLYPDHAMVFRDTTISRNVISACTWSEYTVIENGRSVDYVDLYIVDEAMVYYYKGNNLRSVTLEDKWKHNIPGVPIVEFRVTSHYDSVIEPIMTLQDLINVTLSSYADGRSSFSDAYLVITGMGITEDSANALIDGDKKLLNLPIADGSAYYLTREDSGSDIVTILSDIDDRICEAVNMPSLTDPRYAVSSGAALKAKTMSFCNTCAQYRKSLDSALRYIALITSNFTYEWPEFFYMLSEEDEHRYTNSNE